MALGRLKTAKVVVDIKMLNRHWAMMMLIASISPKFLRKTWIPLKNFRPCLVRWRKTYRKNSGKDCAIKSTRHKSSSVRIRIFIFLLGSCAASACLAFWQFYEIFIILHAIWNKEERDWRWRRKKRNFSIVFRCRDEDFSRNLSTMTRPEPLNGNDVFFTRSHLSVIHSML